jgi:hypothetical protein
MNTEQMRIEFEAWWEQFKSEHEEWKWADREALLFQAWQSALNSQAKSGPDGWKLVPIEPTREMKDAGKYTMKGSADEPDGIRAQMVYQQMLSVVPPTLQQADKVLELEKDAERYRWLCENKLVNWAQIVGFYFDADTGIDQAIDQAMIKRPTND